MKHYYLLIFALILISCKDDNQSFQEKKRNKVNFDTLIKGDWYLNKWTECNTLFFDDSTILVGNSIDTIFRLNYKIIGDTIITGTSGTNKIIKNRVLYLTKDSLSLQGIREIKEIRNYSRINKGFK
jgi:hypothetical protein